MEQAILPKETAAGKKASFALMTRRQLLAGTGRIALVAVFSTACAPVINAPWADGTFWDDGFGWTDD